MRIARVGVLTLKSQWWIALCKDPSHEKWSGELHRARINAELDRAQHDFEVHGIVPAGLQTTTEWPAEVPVPVDEIDPKERKGSWTSQSLV